MGVNIEQPVDYARLPMFVDMMKASRAWGSANAPWDEAAPKDALGWPTTDAGVVIRAENVDPFDSDAAAYRFIGAGTYRLAFTGKANVAPVASAGVQVVGLAYDATANRSTADVQISADASQLMLAFTGTSGGVRDVTLRRPGYAGGETFTSEFKELTAPFGVLRLMDFLATNQTRVRTWSERTVPGSAAQARGGAYEHAIQMANELGKDIWINVPTNADDAHIRSLAQLLKDSLAPGRAVYVEYSNELWNWVFWQSSENLSAAVAEALAGDLSLTNGQACTQAQFDASEGNCNKWWAAFFRVGKKTAQISRIFIEVMGAEAFNTRFRVVYATQFAYRAIGEQVLKNMARFHGAPKTLIYGIAGAPYYTVAPEVYTSPTLTVEQLISALNENVATEFLPSYRPGAYAGGDWTNATQKALADFYGIQSMAYEGGLDLGQSDASLEAKMQANKDPRMGSMLTTNLQQWFGCGNGLYVHYSLSSPWGRFGYWGLTNSPTNKALPRYAAAKAAAETASTLTTCR